MLFFYIYTQKFILLIQSGFYLDFFLKKIGEIFIKNIFIYTGLFFGEKYLIEVLTKKIEDNYVFNVNVKLFQSTLNYYNFFNIVLFSIFYLIFFSLILAIIF
jgi:hypothetical protein